MKALILWEIIFITVHLLSILLIYSYLLRRKERVTSFFLIRVFMSRYLKRYMKITLRENGRVGLLYYFWLISINGALVCFALYLLL